MMMMMPTMMMMLYVTATGHYEAGAWYIQLLLALQVIIRTHTTLAASSKFICLSVSVN